MKANMPDGDVEWLSTIGLRQMPQPEFRIGHGTRTWRFQKTNGCSMGKIGYSQMTFTKFSLVSSPIYLRFHHSNTTVFVHSVTCSTPFVTFRIVYAVVFPRPCLKIF